MAKEYIERKAIYDKLEKEKEYAKELWELESNASTIEKDMRWGIYCGFSHAIRMVNSIPAADVVEVRHGRWELTVSSFYRDNFDESCELCVYIVANCSECSGKHPNSYQVFSKTIYAPEDASDNFRFDKKEEENKALQEFQSRNYQFAYYCPNCGTKMDKEK